MPGTARHDDQAIYYRQYSPRPDAVPAQLGQACVAVIGTGGIGLELLRHLGAAGIGTVLCIDGDCVRASNLNRQHWFGPADIGRRKVDCVRAVMERLFPDTRVVTVAQRIASAAELSDALGAVAACDYLACCADEPVGAIEVACLEAAQAHDCAVGFCAMQLRRGYWGMARDQAARASALAFFTRATRVATAAGLTALRGSSSWTNTIIAAFFAEAVVMYLAGLSPASGDGLTAFDFDTMQAVSTIRFNPESPWPASISS